MEKKDCTLVSGFFMVNLRMIWSLVMLLLDASSYFWLARTREQQAAMRSDLGSLESSRIVL